MDTNSPEWYEYIDSLIFRFQEGEKNIGIELIEIFRAYLNKYLKIIKSANLDLDDRDSRRFISLYISDPEVRKALRYHKQYADVQAEAYKAARRLKGICDSIPEEDIEQELIASLFTLANRYKKKGTKKNFAGYLYNAYRFEIYRRINELTKDPVSFGHLINLSYNDSQNITEIEEHPLLITEFEELPHVLGDELSTNWIYGNVSSEVFEDLTPFERLILKLYYSDGFLDQDIAEKTGYHRNWICRRRHKAIKKIARRMKDEKRKDS